MPDYDTTNKKAPWLIYKDNIKKVVITDGVTNIGSWAFSKCYGLISVEIPNSVTSIGDCVFNDCWHLTSVEIPNSVTSIGDCAFQNCYALTSVEIPNSVTNIGNNTFAECGNLTSIEIPNSVTSIGEKAFSYTALTSVTIPNSVTSIGDWAFYFCESLTSIEIPNSVTSIGKCAFSLCWGLTSITFKGSTRPAFGNDVFGNVNKSIPVYVPANSIEAYKSALEGFGLSNIQANPKQLFLNDNGSYSQNSQIDDAEVSYTRNFTNTNWQAIYLPFSLKYEDWKDDFEVARINGIRQYDDYNIGSINRTELEVVKMTNDDSVIYPNTPYLIRARTPGEKTLSAEKTTVYESKANNIKCSTTTVQFTFIGTYNGMNFSGIGAHHNCYVLDSYGRNIIEGKSFLLPYRWFMKMDERESVYGIKNNTAKEISIRVVGEEATGIANIQHASPNTQIYDLNGRRVNENNLKPGMYVKNGRKFVVR